MNAKSFHVALLIWIMGIAPIAFSETFPSRPTAAEMDEIVELGTECVRGLNERCWATQYQTNPVKYGVDPFTNTTGFYLDQNAMGTMASKIKSLVQYYVDPDTVYDGTINISMLTVAGLFTELDIGDHTSLFTATPAIGTNAATYGDYPWRIYVTNLQERHKVLWAQDKTALPASRPWVEVWQGEGKSSNSYSEAYDRAVTNYGFKTRTYSYSGELMQICKATLWSNGYVQGGSGALNGTGEDGTLETHSDWYPSELIRTDLIVTGASNVVWIAQTNAIVSGAITPDITGNYVEVEPSEFFRYWEGSNSGRLFWYFVGSGAGLYSVSLGAEWESISGNVEGEYTNTQYGAEGIAVVALDIFDVPHTNTVSCGGTYAGEDPTWTSGSWSCTVNGGSRYISQDSGSPPSPAWVKSGTEPAGTYYPSGPGVYGIVTAYTNNIWSDGCGSNAPTMYTPTFTEGTNVTTIFYQCWLTKIMCSNDVYASTNVQHNAGYWVKPVLPNAGASNYWNDQGLGLSSNAWNEREVFGWSYATSNPVLFGDPVTNVPENTVEPTVVNAANCTGFKCSEFKAVTEWDFHYCTDLLP